VLLVLGAVALERAGWLPERMTAVVRTVEGWLEPLPREAGIELPPHADDLPSPSSPTPNDRAANDRAAVAQALVPP
jgi:hypothetical protein